MSNKRITRETMLAEIVSIVAKRSTCLRRQVGALIVRDGRILSIGYAGSPAGLPHCLDVGCLVGPDGGCLRTQHSEANAIAFAARNGIRVEGSDLWCSLTPCLSCAKLIINSGVKRIWALEPYRELSGVDLFLRAGGELFLTENDEFFSITSSKDITSST